MYRFPARIACLARRIRDGDRENTPPVSAYGVAFAISIA
jgi:hypothetical protein